MAIKLLSESSIDGNVGIGTTTPSEKLEVSGNSIISGHATIQNFAYIYGANNAGVFRNTVQNGSVILAGGNGTGDGANISLGGSTGNNDLRIRIGITEALRIDNLRNVGIGNTTPNERLDVTGNIKLSGNIQSTQTALSFLNGGNALPINTNNLLVSNAYSDRSSVPTNGLYVKGQTISGGLLSAQGGAVNISGNVNPQIQFNNGTNTRLLYRSGNDLVWRFDGTNNGTIYHSGNLSPVTTNTVQTISGGKTFNGSFTVGNEGAINLVATATGNVGRITNNGEFALTTTLNGGTTLYYDNLGRLDTRTNGACIFGCGFATDFIASSDSRLKYDHTHFEDPISTIKQLCGKKFKRYDDKTNGCHIGFIAQEVEKVIPELVTTSVMDYSNEKLLNDQDKLYRELGIDNLKGVKYDKIVALLVEGLKAQQKDIEYLKEEIKILNNK